MLVVLNKFLDILVFVDVKSQVGLNFGGCVKRSIGATVQLLVQSSDFGRDGHARR